MAEEKPKGYLVITVIEAAGKNKDELYVWDTAEFEGYVKSELGSDQVLMAADLAILLLPGPQQARRSTDPTHFLL
jgi:hypothetical protein